MSNLTSVRKQLSEIYGGSCTQLVTKSDIKYAQKLQEHAEKGMPYVLPYAQHIAREIGLEPSAILPAPPKRISRIFEKAIGMHNNDLNEVGDVGRVRGLLNSYEDVLALRRFFGVRWGTGTFEHMHVNNHVSVDSVQDFFWEPTKTGRIAFHVNLNVTISGGQSVGMEIQFIHKDMLQTELSTHLNYEKACAVERTAKKENRDLTAEQAESVAQYRESNRSAYLADALNYGMFHLRRPDLIKLEMPDTPLLRLVS